MRPHPTKARDAALALVSRLNGWLITGAIAVSGLLSLVAAHAFHGPTASAGGAAAGSTAGSQPAPQGSTDDGSGGGSSSALQQPAQAPSSAPAAPSPVVSGGS
jgi:hypothetical protein